MFKFSNIWVFLLAVALSAVLWLGISSVTSNAVHVLAKSNFVVNTYGQVSVVMLAASIAWPLIVCLALSIWLPLTFKSTIVGFLSVSAWVVVLLSLTALGADFLSTLGRGAVNVWIFAVSYWILEIGIAMLLLHVTSQPLLSDFNLQSILVGTIVALAWLTLAKAAFLCLSLGVLITMH